MHRHLIGIILMSSMLGSVASAAEPTSVAPAATGQETGTPKLRCKRYVETGSLAKTHKECHTAAEWDRLSQQAREDAKGMLSTVPGQTQPQ